MSKKLTPKQALVKIRKATREGNIKFACSNRVMQYEVLLHDFMEHIMFCDGYMLTDLSSIDEWNDGGTTTQRNMFSKVAKRIKERYDVRMKIGTKKSYYICDVLERLAIKIDKQQCSDS